jgi:hypothetical protein
MRQLRLGEYAVLRANALLRGAKAYGACVEAVQNGLNAGTIGRHSLQEIHQAISPLIKREDELRSQADAQYGVAESFGQ